MKLEFEQDTVPKELAEELGFDEFLKSFDADLPLVPSAILRPMKEDEGKAHFARLAELEARMEKAGADPDDILSRCGKLPSLDAILPFFQNGGLEQFHFFALGNFVSGELILENLENGFPFDSDSDACAGIRSVLTAHMTEGFSNLRFSQDEKALGDKIDTLENELKTRLSDYEKKIFDQTGLKMVWPYPREIPKDSESAAKAETSTCVTVTPNDGMLTVGYALDADVERVVREKEDLSDELSARMDRKMDRINAELRPFFESFEKIYRSRKARALDYAILWAKKKDSLCFPKFRTETGCELKNAALPCLRESRGDKYVPLTADLERGSNVLFGANMTGKTTVLKTIYFHLTLIRMGLPVPAESVALRFPEEVEIQLKSSGSLRSNMSGFGEEIRFFTRPVFFNKPYKPVKPSAYVLVDELFQSTDPVSGSELSRIYLEKFSTKDLVFFCTSHYPEVLFVPDISLMRMRDMAFDPDSGTDIADFMNTIPYALERIPPEGIEDALRQSGKTLQIALRFPLPEADKAIIRMRSKHLNTSVLDRIFDSYSLKDNVSRLDGYLDAIASVSGDFRDFVFRADLLGMGNKDALQTVEKSLSEEWSILEFRRIDNLCRQLGETFGQWFLINPFSEFSNSFHGVLRTKSELIWQATDQIDLMFPHLFEPESYWLRLENLRTKKSEAIAIVDKNRVVFLHFIENMRGFAIYALDSGYGDHDIVSSLKSGEGRFGWSYLENADLNLLTQKINNNGWYSLSMDERECYQRFLLELKAGDFVIYVDLPEKGECTFAKVTGPYFWRYQDEDFNHRFPVDPESVYSFSVKDKRVSPKLRSQLRSRGRCWRVSFKRDFVALVKHLSQGRHERPAFSAPRTSIEKMDFEFLNNLEIVTNEQWIAICRYFQKDEMRIMEAMDRVSKMITDNHISFEKTKNRDYYRYSHARLKKIVGKLPETVEFEGKPYQLKSIACEAARCAIHAFHAFDENIDQKDKLDTAIVSLSPFKWFVNLPLLNFNKKISFAKKEIKNKGETE